MAIKLAFFKGPAPTILRRIDHAVICWRTRGPYSHVEFIAPDGTGWSSRVSTHGIAPKQIDFTQPEWDVIEVPGDADALLAWFVDHQGTPYDYISLLSWLVWFRVSYGHWWFCSKPIADFFHMPDPWEAAPNDVYRFLTATR